MLLAVAPRARDVLDAPHCVHVSSEMGLTSILFTHHLRVCAGIDVALRELFGIFIFVFSPDK